MKPTLLLLSLVAIALILGTEGRIRHKITWRDEMDESVGKSRGGKCSDENYRFLLQENLKQYKGAEARIRMKMFRQHRACGIAIFKKMCSGCGYDKVCYQRNGHKYRTPATLPSQCKKLKTFGDEMEEVGFDRPPHTRPQKPTGQSIWNSMWDETDDEEAGSWSPPSFCGELCKDHKNKQSCLSNCRQRDEMNDEDDEEVGGVWGKIGGIIGNDIWNRPVADGSCRGRCRRLRTRVEDVARRLPDPRGDEESDWEPPVRRLRERDGWGYGNDFRGPCRKQKLPWGAPFYVKGAHCDRRADRYTFYGCSDYKCQACTRNTWDNLGELSPATRRIINC